LCRGYTRRHQARCRPRLEALEDRLAPAVLTVNTLDDAIVPDGVLSLREAIAVVNSGSTAGLSAAEVAQVDQSTNALGTNDLIQFAPGLASATNSTGGPVGTVVLSLGQLELNWTGSLSSNLIKIDGTGPITISGNNCRIFQVNGGAQAELDNLTLVNGNSQFDLGINNGPGGGAIYNAGSLTLSGCHLTGNYAGWLGGYESGSGGAILNRGTMTINNSVLSDNQAFSTGGDWLGGGSDGGGAIENFGSLTIHGGTLSGNTSDQQGGAIYNRGGSVTIDLGCKLSGNTADPSSFGWGPNTGAGGGISNFGGTVTISDSTLSGNATEGNGGAIRTVGGSLTMTNCTVGGATSADGNTAQGDGGGIYHNGGTFILSTTNGDNNPCLLSHNSAKNGGAIATIGGSPNLTGWTLSDNTGYVDGGGMFIDPAVVTIISCTFTGNTAPVGADLYNLDSTVTIIASQISGISGSGGTVTDPFADLTAQIAALNLTAGVKNSLTNKLQAADQSLEGSNTTAGLNQLDAFIHQIDALVNSDRLGELTADALIGTVDDLVSLLG
jgi:predicted outer membrane repeat protein